MESQCFQHWMAHFINFVHFFCVILNEGSQCPELEKLPTLNR